MEAHHQYRIEAFCVGPRKGVVQAEGVLSNEAGTWRFTEITLRPVVIVMREKIATGPSNFLRRPRNRASQPLLSPRGNSLRDSLPPGGSSD